MTLYQRMADARVRLQSMSLKKSGNNAFSKKKYYELGDFLPAINQICKELDLMPAISFTSDMATLTVYDAIEPSNSIVFTTPMAETNLKNCHPVQNLGATETYTRRYLYTTAFEIVESDWVDGSDYVSEAKLVQNLNEKIPKHDGLITEQDRQALIHTANDLHGAKAKECLQDLIRAFNVDHTSKLPNEPRAFTDFVVTWPSMLLRAGF